MMRPVAALAIACFALQIRGSPLNERRDASTALRLHPVKVQSLRGRPDGRAPIDIRITAEGTPEAGAILAERGTWEVIWPGAAPRRRFTADSGQAAAIELETTRGRCERAQKRCLLRANEISKRVDVAVR
jgi:hypothetical protein